MSNKLFLHEEMYRGKDLVDKLSKFQIAICGAGTIGSNLIDTLARQGFQHMMLIDMDRVEEHNINTQIYGKSDVGALKVAAAQNRLYRDIGVAIEVSNKELTSKNIQKLLKGHDLVVDAFDNSESRELLQQWSRSTGVPCLHAGLFEDYGEVVWDEHYKVPSNVEGDVCEYPLARNLATLVVTIVAEEMLDFCLSDNPRMKSHSVTLKDLQIKSYV